MDNQPRTDRSDETPPVGDPVHRLRTLLPELRERYHVVDLAVFGSRARRDATPRSDLDLLVTFDSEASLFDLVEMELELEERLGVQIDVVTPGSIKPRLRNRVLESAVPVCGDEQVVPIEPARMRGPSTA